MANRESGKHTRVRSSAGVCQTSGPKGVHAVAEQYKSNNKVSKVNAYKYAIEFCKTSIEEVKAIAKSLQVEYSELLPN